MVDEVTDVPVEGGIHHVKVLVAWRLGELTFQEGLTKGRASGAITQDIYHLSRGDT